MLKFFAKLPPCLIGIEACASSHYWARELVALGHDVKLMPAQYVKPYVKRGKNDAADAEAICEAVTRPTMRFVGIKSPEQQSAMMLHRVRVILSRQRTQLSNALRAHLAEFGIDRADRQERNRSADRRHRRQDGCSGATRCADVPGDAGCPAKHREGADPRERSPDHGKCPGDRAWPAADGNTRRRPVAASAFVAAVPDPAIFGSGRNLAAWIGLVPRQNSSGGKERLGSITKAGHRYLRQMLIVGAMAVVRYADRNGTKRPWLVQLLARRTAKVAAVALANRNARMIWAMMASGERYREPQIA